MTLTKRKLVTEIGQRTRLKNRDVQAVVEALIDVCTEAIVNGEKIELENFLVIEVHTIQRDYQPFVENAAQMSARPRPFRQVVIHASKHLRNLLKNAV